MIRDRVLNAIRRWNREWLDRLDPDYPPPKPARPPVTVHAEPTPNPEAMKFVASASVPTLGPDHPLQHALLNISGVKSIFAIENFVTITRERGEDWNQLLPRVEAVLVDHL